MKKLPRLFDWLLVTIVLLVLIALLAPHQLPVSLYKLSLVTMAGVAGYWLDRSLFPYARPDTLMAFKLEPWHIGTGLALMYSLAMIRRAIIVGCAMLAMGLGA